MDNHFDIVVLGTGLVESVVAAALSKAGFKVVHVDENSYYGSDEASLSLEEFIKWADDRSAPASEHDSETSLYLASQRSKFTSITHTATDLPIPRGYSLSLSPSIIPAVGPLTASLISSGVSRYGGFRLLGRVAIYDRSGKVKSVPESKEHIFKSQEISLLDKRRLMRVLTFAAGEFEGKAEIAGKEDIPFYNFLCDVFSLNSEAAEAIAFALTYCVSTSDATLPALKRLRRYLRSAGRYGASPFLVGYYGGAGEIAQGFCRASAVSGGIYILGKHISSIVQSEDSTLSHHNRGAGSPPSNYVLTLDDFPDPITCRIIISSSDYASPNLCPSIVPSPVQGDIKGAIVARCIAIIDQPISFTPLVDSLAPEVDETLTHEGVASQKFETSLLIFPPSSLDGGSATASANVLITGADSMSAPEGKWILYISMPIIDSAISPEAVLRPYLVATLALVSRADTTLPVEPLFTTFYIQHFPSPLPSATGSKFLISPPPSHLLSESLDSVVTNAEAVFWHAVDLLKPSSTDLRTEKSAEASAENFVNIDSFWPPLSTDPGEESDEW